jgi:hypothetical protein
LAGLDASLRDFTLGWDRKTAGLGVEFVQSERLRYEADWKRQTKEGRGLTWGSFLGNAQELAKPLDYQTDEVDAALVYTGSGWNIRLGYYGSFFSNQDNTLTWDNPFNGPDRGRMAMAPDNTYHQAKLSGAYHFSTWDTTLNASYSRRAHGADGCADAVHHQPGDRGAGAPRAGVRRRGADTTTRTCA